MARKIGAPVYALPEDISEVKNMMKTIKETELQQLNDMWMVLMMMLTAVMKDCHFQVNDKMVMTVYASLMLADAIPA